MFQGVLLESESTTRSKLVRKRVKDLVKELTDILATSNFLSVKVSFTLSADLKHRHMCLSYRLGGYCSDHETRVRINHCLLVKEFTF